MKHFLLLTTLLCLVLSIHAQGSIFEPQCQYVYDNSGNRISKCCITQLSASGGVEEGNVLGGIDSADHEEWLQENDQLKDLDENLQFSVYPNPTIDLLFIESNRLSETTLKYYLFDVQGIEVKTGTVSSTKESVDVNFLAAGTYILRIGDEGIFQWEIIKR